MKIRHFFFLTPGRTASFSFNRSSCSSSQPEHEIGGALRHMGISRGTGDGYGNQAFDISLAAFLDPACLQGDPKSVPLFPGLCQLPVHGIFQGAQLPHHLHSINAGPGGHGTGSKLQPASPLVDGNHRRPLKSPVGHGILCPVEPVCALDRYPHLEAADRTSVV